ncbi:MAG: MFS transporter [Kaiparowitsia implicata GSE-PSE-MK54-09C]|jgi:predicted transcriptional regulator|nr:MFS transporter [Kaiparowitsia implicata GSE-PSE-MK54-09C]
MSSYLLFSLTRLGWLAQAPTQSPTLSPTADPGVVLFSGPQFFIALVSGVLLAFAIQLLLTNFSVAAGISFVGTLGNSDDSSDSNKDTDGGSMGSTIRKVGLGLGLWTLITVTIALFLACYLAVQLSLLADSGLGAIVGLVIWAAYFSLLVWFSSSTVGSLIGSVVNAATSGFQAVLGAATAALGSRAAKHQAVSTAEAIVEATRNQLGSAIDPLSIRESIEDYVGGLNLPQLDMSQLRRDFESLLNDPEFVALADNDRLHNIDRQTFIDLVSSRTDFSRQEVNRVAKLLEGVWRQTLGQRKSRNSMDELVSYLQATQPGQLQTKELNAKLDRLLAERSQQSGQGGSSQGGGFPQSLQAGMSMAISMLLSRTDLSDLNLEQILNRLKHAPDELAKQTSKVAGQLQGAREPYSPIRQDVEDYLLNKPSWQMNPKAIDREFRDLLYDPSADPGAIAQQLSQINRAYFADVLSSRGLFTQAKINRLADYFNTVRKDVLDSALTAKELEKSTDVQRRVEIYLTATPKEQLHASSELPGFRAILADEEANYETLSTRLSAYNRTLLLAILTRRNDMTPAEAEPILNNLETTRDRVLFDAKSVDEQARQKLTEFEQKLESYLVQTGRSELNPEGIKRDMQVLLNDPQLGLEAIRYRASQFDRDTFVQLLSQRNDINAEDAEHIMDQVESNWYSFTHAPSIVATVVKERYDETLSSLADYLRQTHVDALDPDGIQRDLTTLFKDPQEGAIALQHRLSQIDRETLVQLLSQRQDLSEEQVNRTIDQVQTAIQQIVRAPRRFALRTQQQVMDFEHSVEDYLRNTEKEELNPDGIKRDLNLLMQSPKLGLRSLGDRLSHFDRSTLVALLSQRDDMSPEDVERTVQQIEATRDQILAQLRQVQYRIQAVVDRIFGRIRDYLNSLDRPELNYDGIRRDVRTLFNDPQAGFEALRHRLSEFDRETLVAILSSRDDISEADVNRIIDQVESARINVLQRAERIQTEAQRRLEEVKEQTQRQVEETRKASAAAAWWLFLTALSSAAAAAGAGALAAG